MFHLAFDDGIGIYLKQETRVYGYAYHKGRLKRHKLSKDGLHHFLLVVLLIILP